MCQQCLQKTLLSFVQIAHVHFALEIRVFVSEFYVSAMLSVLCAREIFLYFMSYSVSWSASSMRWPMGGFGIELEFLVGRFAVLLVVCRWQGGAASPFKSYQLHRVWP